MLTYNVPVTYVGPVYGGGFTVRKNGELINYSGLQGTVINDGPQTASPVGTQVVIDLTGYPNGSLTPADEILVKNAYPERFVSGGTTDNGNGVDVVGIPSETQFVSLTDGVTVTGDPASGVMLIEPLGGIRVLDDGRVLLGSVAHQNNSASRSETNFYQTVVIDETPSSDDTYSLTLHDYGDLIRSKSVTLVMRAISVRI